MSFDRERDEFPAQQGCILGITIIDTYQLLERYAAGEKNFYLADLRATHLYRANLKSAKLKFANLSEVKLSCAHLEGANLCCATLEHTDGLLLHLTPVEREAAWATVMTLL